MTIRVHTLFLVILIPGFVGCAAAGDGPTQQVGTDASSGVHDAGTTDGAPDTAAVLTGPTAEVACEQFGAALCQQIETLGPYGMTARYGDRPTCAARVKVVCLDQMRAPGTGATVAWLTSCTQSIPALTIDDIAYRRMPACDFKGTRPNGSACGSGAQCHSGYCALTNAACGTCAPLVAAGGRCTQDDDCQAGLACNDVGTCVLPSAPGAACNDAAPCNLGFYCKNGSCATQAMNAGDACDGPLDSCYGPKGLFCNSQVNKCQKGVFAGAGEVCGYLAPSVVSCHSSSLCVGPRGSLTGLCSSVATDGDVCSADKPCMWPAVCAGGRCTLPNSLACN